MSLVDLVVDGVSEVIGGGVGPGNDRGVVATFSIGSFGLLGSVWLIATSADPLSTQLGALWYLRALSSLASVD